MDNERIEKITKIAKELERLIEEENPEALKKLKDPEILERSFGGAESAALFIIADTVLTIVMAKHIIDLNQSLSKVKEILKNTEIQEDKIDKITSNLVQFTDGLEQESGN